MQITIYNNASDPRRATKDLSNQIKATAINFYEESTVEEPNVLMKYNADYAKANYCYIPQMNRYYYIDSVSMLNSSQMILRCRSDVLMSFAIRQLTAVISRNENLYNLYYPDKAFKVLQSSQVVTKKFPQGFTANSNILFTVAGGGNT